MPLTLQKEDYILGTKYIEWNMAELTEQQEHLQNVVNQQNQLIADINDLQQQINERREEAVKLQGIMEYLTSVGVTLPEPEGTVEETAAETETEETTSGKGFADK